MKNKGFTLIEMVATILVITVITLLVVPFILNNVNNKRKDISGTAKQMIYDAADMYVKENGESYPSDNGAIYCIKLETLVNSGRLSNPVKDLKSNREVPLNYYVKTTIDQYGQYSYNLVDNKSCTPALAYYIADSNNYTSEKSVTIKYPANNLVKKYKVLSGTTKEGITLNTEMTVSENPTITFTSNGSIEFWLEDNGDKLGDTTVNITKIDTTAPTLALSKITYKNIPFDNSWTLTNSTIGSDGVLTMGADGNDFKAASDYIDVNGGFHYYTFDAYSETAAPQHGNNGGVYWEMVYYDSNKQSTTALDEKARDGHAVVSYLNQWRNDIYWKTVDEWKSRNRYGPNVKYVRFSFKNSSYSAPPVKLRNLKIYGEEMPNSFYLINVSATDSESKIKEIKYAKGDKDSRYFENAGTKVEQNQIRVTSNGVYSVCATDNSGNMTIQKITINNIN